jgi:peroxiredoxin Q/BCP
METSKIKVPTKKFPVTGGDSVSFKDLKGKYIVLYFYPKDATPGCTIEGHEFTKLKTKFDKLDAVIYGVSRDSLESHEKFKANECYSIELLSDEDETLCKAFDVIKDKNMYGKMVKGIERSTFILDQAGKVIFEWRKVKAEGHAQEVFDKLKEITLPT